MKRIVFSALLAFATMALTSCGVAEGLAKTVGRTGQSIVRTAGNVGNSITR